MWEFRPLALLPLISALSIIVNIIVYLLKAKKSSLLFSFIAYLFIMFLWPFGQAIQYCAASNDLVIFTIYLIHTSINFVGLMWFLFTIHFTSTDGKLYLKKMVPLLVFPLIGFILFLTNQYHHLYFQSIGYDPRIVIKVSYGLCFWFTALTTYSYVIAGAVRLAKYAVRKTGVTKGQAIILTFGPLLPLFASIAYTIYIVVAKIEIPEFFDLTPSLFAISVTIYSIAVFKFRFLDIVPGALKKIFENLPDSILVVDNYNSIVNLNDSFINNFGNFNNHENISYLINELQIAFIKNQESERILKAIEYGTEEPVTKGEVVLQEPLSKTYEVNIQKLELHKNMYQGRIITFHDVTEHKRLLEELIEANGKLKKLDSVKNDFIANITHDFRSPLTLILNTADINLKKHRDNPYQEQFELIRSSAYRMMSFIDRLLDLAKMDAQKIKLKVTKTDIVKFVKKIVHYYQSAVTNTNIEIITKFPKKSVENFYTDEEKLDEVISNILSNAVKYVGIENGRIEIEVKDEAETILIVISDNGIGIPQDKLEIIFNRFEQLEVGRNTKHGGSGIGLAFAKQLVECMMGTIRAESGGESQGSRFIIQLPKGKSFFNEDNVSTETMNSNTCARLVNLTKYDIDRKIQQDKLELYIKERNKETEFNPKKSLILIIDDDKPMAELVMNYLLMNGFLNFIIANSGKIGLEAVYQYTPDIIICDYNMPGMTGKEVHDSIVENPKYKQIPFIFLSAVADRNLIIERREKGANAYLKKPIEEKDLVLTVNLHLKKYFDYLITLELAATDELTGLYNRREIIKRLNNELSVRKLRELSLLIFDLDHFKDINDQYGHQCGDQVLKTIGKLIKENLRPYDIPGRYGGDEFLVILPETNAENAVRVGEILRKLIAEQNVKYGETIFSITCSFGVSSLIAHQNDIARELQLANLKEIYEVKDPEQSDWNMLQGKKQQVAELLLSYADKALYRSKNTVCNVCGYFMENRKNLTDAFCPKCDSKEIVYGKNKVTLYS